LVKNEFIIENASVPKDKVGGSIPNCEIVSLLDRKICQVAKCLLCVKMKQKEKKNLKKKKCLGPGFSRGTITGKFPQLNAKVLLIILNIDFGAFRD